MTVPTLLRQIETAGVRLFLEAGSLRYQARPGAFTPELREAVSRHKAALLELLKEPRPFSADPCSALVARVQAAWPWLAEHRPDLYRAVCDADEAGDLARLYETMEEASWAYENRLGTEGAVRIYSRMLDTELWIAATEDEAAELRRDGISLPILLVDEAEVLAGMSDADTRTFFEALRQIQGIAPGAILRSATIAQET